MNGENSNIGNYGPGPRVRIHKGHLAIFLTFILLSVLSFYTDICVGISTKNDDEQSGTQGTVSHLLDVVEIGEMVDIYQIKQIKIICDPE